MTPPRATGDEPPRTKGEPNSGMLHRTFISVTLCAMQHAKQAHARGCGERGEGSEDLLYGMTGLSILQLWSQVKRKTTGSTQCWCGPSRMLWGLPG